MDQPAWTFHIKMERPDLPGRSSWTKLFLTEIRTTLDSSCPQDADSDPVCRFHRHSSRHSAGSIWQNANYSGGRKQRATANLMQAENIHTCQASKKPFLLMLLTNQAYFYSAFTNMGPFICSGDMDTEKGGNSAPVSIFATGYSWCFLHSMIAIQNLLIGILSFTFISRGHVLNAGLPLKWCWTSLLCYGTAGLFRLIKDRTLILSYF